MATIVDIAERTAVSVATVSRVFNRPNDVADETRERVYRAAQELNYRPSADARNLRSGRKQGRRQTCVVGYVTARGSILNGEPFAHEALEAAESALCERGLGIRIIPAMPQGDVPREVRDREVDGVISRFTSPLVREMAKHVPMVTLDYFDPLVPAFAVVPDYAAGVRLAVSRLLAAGHRHIALLANDPATSPVNSFWQIFPATGQAVFDEQHEPLPPTLFAGAAADPRHGYEIGLRLFADRGRLPSAVVGPDGAMLGLYRAAGEKGVRIPDEVSVVGINGLRNGEYLNPPLTTIDVQIEALAREAVNVLAESIKTGTSRQGMEMMPVFLRERASARW